MAINKFLGNSIISRLKDCTCSTNEEIRACLAPDMKAGDCQWRDLSGLLAPQTEIEKLINDIESDKISSIDDINSVFAHLHKSYYSLEWTWAWARIQEYYRVTIDTITKEKIIYIIEEWKDAVVELDKLIYENTKKEFSLSARIGFGIDSNKKDQDVDFEQVRGAFEQNSFVETVLTHIKVKSKLGEDMIRKLTK